MEDQTAHIQQAVTKLICAGQSFAIWRQPREKCISFAWQQTGETLQLKNLSELNQVTSKLTNGCFVLAPFLPNSYHPFVLISGIRSELPIIAEIEKLAPVTTYTPTTHLLPKTEERRRDYEQRFERFIQEIQKGKFEKLVLSRCQSLHITGDRSKQVAIAFTKALHSYPETFVYLMHTPQTGVWMGCTPELLLCRKKECWQTVALAGTQLWKNKGSFTWDEKNQKEQALVAQYIQKQLKQLKINCQIEKAETVKAGALAHLRSNCFFNLPNNVEPWSVLEALHPTPAVLGLPKREALDFILQEEGYDRSYYAGFVGPLIPHAETTFYVNLRSMQLNCSTGIATLYAGSGLLETSTLTAEWQETEAKMETMRRLIQNN